MATHIFKLPDLGEGLQDAEIRAIHVSVSQQVKEDQLLLTVETAKAQVDIPSPVSGIVTAIHIKLDDVVAVGTALVEFESTQPQPASIVGEIKADTTPLPTFNRTAPSKSVPNATIKAPLAVRQLAKSHQIDLSQLNPTGPNHTITENDVLNAVKTSQNNHQQHQRSVHRAMADAMQHAKENTVPVTVMDDVALSNANHCDLTVHIINALLIALKAHPELNGWYHHSQRTFEAIDTIHLGLAVDSGEALFVPVIKNAQQQTDLRTIINRFKSQAEQRSFTLADFQGATFTLSNFGNHGGRYASVILTPPQVGILGTGKIYHTTEKQQTISWLPLSLTFDHRALTGLQANRFLNTFKQAINQNK